MDSRDAVDVSIWVMGVAALTMDTAACVREVCPGVAVRDDDAAGRASWNSSTAPHCPRLRAAAHPFETIPAAFVAYISRRRLHHTADLSTKRHADVAGETMPLRRMRVRESQHGKDSIPFLSAR